MSSMDLDERFVTANRASGIRKYYPLLDATVLLFAQAFHVDIIFQDTAPVVDNGKLWFNTLTDPKSYNGGLNAVKADNSEWFPIDHAGFMRWLNNNLATLAPALNIPDDSLTNNKFAANSVTTDKIVDGTILSQDIALGQITGVLIEALALNNDHYTDNSVDGRVLADGQVGTSHVINAAITAAKMAINSIDTDSVIDGSITAAKLAPGAIDGLVLSDNSVGLNHMVNDSVGTDEIIDNAIIRDKLADEILIILENPYAKIGLLN